MILKLNSLEMDGFQTHKGKTVINFAAGVTYLRGDNRVEPQKMDSNGAGKTTILNALPWVLYGRLPSGIGADDVVNWERSSCQVYADLNDLKVWRSRTPKKTTVKVQVRNGEIEQGDVVVMDKRIQSILRVSFKTFCASLFFNKTSSSVQFIKCNPATRSEILSELIDARPFRLAATAVYDDIKAHDIELTALKTSISHQEQELEALNKDINEFNLTLRNNEQIHKNNVAKLKDKMEQIKAEIKALEMVIMTDPESAAKVADERRIDHQQALTRVETELLELHAKLGSVRSRLSLGEPCPACLRPVDRETLVARSSTVADTQAEIQTRSDQVRHLKRAVEAARAERESYRRALEEKWAAPKRVAELKRDYFEAQDQIKDPPSLQALKEQMRSKVEDRRNRMLRISDAQGVFQDLESKKSNLEILYLGFNTEIKNLLFDQLRSYLHIYTQDYLNTLMGGTIKITYPSSSKTGREQFKILVSHNGFEQELESMSEGEHWRASLAVLLALRKTLLAHSRSCVPFLLIDDPIGGLDQRGTAVFQEVLERLSQEEGISILVTLPRDNLIPKSAHSICVIKTKERGSYIEG